MTIEKIATGVAHSMLLTADHQLWAMGNDSYGQLCDGGTTTQRTPVKTLAGVRDVALGGKHSLILKTDDSLWACGSNEFGQLGNGGPRNRSGESRVGKEWVRTGSARWWPDN